ncbi:MAG: Hsp20/alpha crystallin family protein [Betaproteobacteria bacterium]
MNTVQVVGPFADAGLDELVRGFFRPVRVAGSGAVPIKIDVIEKGDSYVVLAEIPGVTKDAINVTIEGNAVTIATEAKIDAEAKDGERTLRSERHAGPRARSFVLPVELDEAASHAKYEAGVLELTLTKKAPVAGRKLTIQ